VWLLLGKDPTRKAVMFVVVEFEKSTHTPIGQTRFEVETEAMAFYAKCQEVAVVDNTGVFFYAE
jgi:hypothetical protein